MKREPLLSYEDIYGDAGPAFATIDSDVRFVDFFMSRYEAARQNDGELIQLLVDVLQQVADEGTWTAEMSEAIKEAERHGFKPSQP